MTPEIIEVVQGNTSEVKLVRPDFPGLSDALDGNWSCHQAVIDCDGNAVVAKQTITAKQVDENGKERFIAAVKPVDTATLTVPAGEPYMDYLWLIEVANATTTPPCTVEHQITLRVKPQGLI